MAKKISVKKYTGVYFTESTIRKWRERPDRCYWVAFKDTKTAKLCWERCGWASDGWTPEAAQNRRRELLEQDRAGAYKPKRERKADQMAFRELMEEHYLPWSKDNKKRHAGDEHLYRNWLKPRFGDKELRQIAPLDLERLKKEMRDAGKAEATVRHALCLVRQSFNKVVVCVCGQARTHAKGLPFPPPIMPGKGFSARMRRPGSSKRSASEAPRWPGLPPCHFTAGCAWGRSWASLGAMLT